MFIKYESLFKTLTFAIIHFIVGFTVAYIFTGSIALAGGIAIVEPLANTVVFYFHEKLWKKYLRNKKLFPNQSFLNASLK